MSESPDDGASLGVERMGDALSGLLSRIRLTGVVQFCFMPTGAWQTDAGRAFAALHDGREAGLMPFHIIAKGSCWMRTDAGAVRVLEEGDVLVFPFGAGHAFGVGEDGASLTPTRDLPARPWSTVPVLRYGPGGDGARLICGCIRCEAIRFTPLRAALPELIHVRTRAPGEGGWLRLIVEQMVREVDEPKPGGLSMLPRLTELIFIELLRRQISAAVPEGTGWLAALGDPSLARCLSLIHDAPHRHWTLAALAEAAGLSRSALADRFTARLGIPAMRYVREWRLYLASLELRTTRRPIAAVADESGYATEAAFSRAFSRTFGQPPASYRAQAQGQA